MPEGVCVADFGIRGLDLAYALLEGWEAVILVDAMPRGQSPGTLYVLEPQADAAGEADPAGSLMEAHSMNPMKVLRAAIRWADIHRRSCCRLRTDAA